MLGSSANICPGVSVCLALPCFLSRCSRYGRRAFAVRRLLLDLLAETLAGFDFFSFCLCRRLVIIIIFFILVHILICITIIIIILSFSFSLFSLSCRADACEVHYVHLVLSVVSVRLR